MSSRPAYRDVRWRARARIWPPSWPCCPGEGVITEGRPRCRYLTLRHGNGAVRCPATAAPPRRSRLPARIPIFAGQDTSTFPKRLRTTGGLSPCRMSAGRPTIQTASGRIRPGRPLHRHSHLYRQCHQQLCQGCYTVTAITTGTVSQDRRLI